MSPSLWEAGTNFCATWSQQKSRRCASGSRRVRGERAGGPGGGEPGRRAAGRPGRARRVPPTAGRARPRARTRGDTPGTRPRVGRRGRGDTSERRAPRLARSLFKTRKPRARALVYVNPETAGGGAPRGRRAGEGRAGVTLPGRAAERRAQPSRGGDHRCPWPGTRPGPDPGPQTRDPTQARRGPKLDLCTPLQPQAWTLALALTLDPHPAGQ